MESAVKFAKTKEEISDEEEGGIDGDSNRKSFMDQQMYTTTAVQRLSEKLNTGDLPPPSSLKWQRINISPEQAASSELNEVCQMLHEALNLRKKWTFVPNAPPEGLSPNTRPFDPFNMKKIPSSKHSFVLKEGIFSIFAKDDAKKENALWAAPSIDEYYKDLKRLMNIVEDGPCKSFCFGRLAFLEAKFNMHLLLNEFVELAAIKQVPKRDIYNVRKVDTHIHHSSIMNQKHLLKFIKKKLRTEGQETVIYRDGRYWTLQEVFDSLSLNEDTITVDTLDCHADRRYLYYFNILFGMFY